MMLPRGKMSIIMGGQAGSESKGKMSAWLCEHKKPDLLVMTSSPNAGHTCILPDGTKKVSYHLPIGSVMCNCPIILTAASIINPITLGEEITALGIDPRRIIIDHRASVLLSRHIQAERENLLSDLGSTLQGVGSCRSSKMMRAKSHIFASEVAEQFHWNVADTCDIINSCLENSLSILCESTQGFDLDLEHGIDRHYCTSKMVNPSMILAEAGVAPQRIGNIYGVIRPYPIRVNNRTGTSGPYAESKEIAWSDVAKNCGFPGDISTFGEITTTTKLPRRVFEFSWSRFRRFCRVCRPTHLCLQFANYIDWSVYESTDSHEVLSNSRISNFINRLENISKVCVVYIGTGPGHNHMIELWGGNGIKSALRVTQQVYRRTQSYDESIQ